MLRSVELELKTISEANAREFWRARADRRGGQRDLVREALNEQFGAPPPFSVILGGWTHPNQIEITLTRLAPGELDPDENLPMAFKAIKDEIAAWFAVDDRDKRLRWRFAQERTTPGVYKIRIEVRDLTLGDDIRVQLATQAERDSGALQRVHPKRKPPAPTEGQAVLTIMRCFAALPWEQQPCKACVGTELPAGTPCDRCNGSGRSSRLKLAPVARFVGLDNPPDTISVPAPAEHVRRWPGPVTLHRRRFKSAATGICWLYEERNASR